MNEFLNPKNPEDDELITESLGNPKEGELSTNSIDGQTDPNSQDPQLANDLQEILEENANSQQYLKESLDRLIRELRVLQLLKAKEDVRSAVEIEPKKKIQIKIQIKGLNNEIYTTFLMAFSPERLRKMSRKNYHGEAFNEAWLWTVQNYDPDRPNSNFVGYFLTKYIHLRGNQDKKLPGDIERKDKGIKSKKIKNPKANDDESQPKTKTIYSEPLSLNEPIKNADRDESQELMDIIPFKEQPKRINFKQRIAWLKSEPDILRQTPLFPNIKDSPTLLDVGLLIVEYYERQEICTMKKLMERLGVTSSQFYDSFKKLFITLVREHFEQSQYNKYNNEEE